MTIEADLRGILTTSTSVAAFSSNRVYQDQLPQNVTYPAISFFLVSAPRIPLMGTDAVNIPARFQFDCWGASPSSANSLKNAVIASIERYKSSTGTMVIESIFIDEEQTIPERDPDEEVFRRTIDAIVNYKSS
jgi:hypothetical protein